MSPLHETSEPRQSRP